MKKDFYGELANYLGADRGLTEKRCLYAPYELAWLWHEKQGDIKEFYRDNKLYLFDLSMYHTLLQARGTHKWFKDMLYKHEITTMLDFGGGIGEYTLLACQSGVNAIYTDMEGSPVMEYANWRFKMYGVNPIIENENFFLVGPVDLIVAMDVFEHLENPAPLIEDMSKKTQYLMCNPEEIPYNSNYPQHISHFNLEPHFKKVGKYLWKSALSE